MAKFCCSIEMEPKTLNEGQISLAREVAVDIVQNKEPNEASNIFVKVHFRNYTTPSVELLKGMKPVAAIKEMAQTIQKGDSIYKQDDHSKDMKTDINQTSCQCSFTSTIIDSPDNSMVKEPLSAPF